MFYIVEKKNVLLSKATLSDILESEYLPIVFHLLEKQVN
jgi:hypothetical protein